MYKDVIEEIKKNTLDLITEEELAERLRRKGSLVIKFGVDATAADIHLGHIVILRKLRQLQELGHTVAFIIGDFTARIGDPSFRTNQRRPLSRQEIIKNAQTYTEQVFRVLDKHRTKIYYNSTWFDTMSLDNFLELLSSYTVQRLLEREDFKTRVKKQIPLSTAELIYPFLQAYDSIHVDSDVEIGGSDQLFNLILARNIQRSFQRRGQVIMTLPLLEGTDGRLKMSKSYNNYISINDSYELMYAKLMSIPDSLIIKYMRLLTNIEERKIIEYEDSIKDGAVNPKEIKIILAKEIVNFFYGKEKAEKAHIEFERVYKYKLPPTKLKEYVVESKEHSIVDLLIETKLVNTRSEAKYFIRAGAVLADRKKITDINSSILINDEVILQLGKHKFVKVCLSKK